MSAFKCKMCGGTIEFEQGASVGVCDSCGTKQTLPKLDDDRRANLYDRANHFRRNNEFDKAMGIYESILNEDNTDAEAYWSLVLCRYGIEYVEDPASHKRVPTVNRAQYTSIFADEDFKSALANADDLQKTIYEEEANTIDEIQKGILEISQKEEPFDVFICYKETGADGRRTIDSVRATELYHELTNEGFKVFFSRITLEDKLGTAFEPYIFAALNSAKVMVVLGTKQEHFNAVWVKNEWSRYLSLIKSGAKKTLIPAYQDMDPYDLPEEFSHLQAQDMTKLGFMQDLIRGIKKITSVDEPKPVIKETVVVNNSSANASVAPLLKRVYMFLEDGDFVSANDYCEKVLDQDPECAEAYLGKLMAELAVKTKDGLKDVAQPFESMNNCIKASRFDSAIAEKLKADNEFIRERNENNRIEALYNSLITEMSVEKTEGGFKSIAKRFESIKEYKDSEEKQAVCLQRAEDARKDAIYLSAVKLKSKGYVLSDRRKNYIEAKEKFESIIEWKDSKAQIDDCENKIKKLEADIERNRLAEEKEKAFIKKIIMIGAPAFVILIIALIIYSKAIVPAVNYKRALADIESGNYSSAYNLFDLNPDYKDTPEKKRDAKIKEAKELIASKEYEAADEIYEEIYEDSADDEIINTLNQLVREKKYDAAISFAEYIDDYSKQNDFKNKCSYKYARELADQKKYEEAYTLMDKIGDYENAEELSKSYKYLHAKQLLAKKDYIGGYELLEKIEDYKDSKKLMEDNKFNYQLQLLKKAEAGDKVTFGTYEQDNDTTNGAEDINWVVVKVSGNKVMLVSEKILDAKQFGSSSKNVTWENSSVMSWLNSDFYNTAFSTKEQGYIVSGDSTNVTSTEETENMDEISGDKVSLLTKEERKEFDIYKKYATEYAKSTGLYVSGSYYSSDRYSPYWLRTNDDENSDEIMYYGYGLYSDDPTELKGIVPVIWVEIK